MDWPVLVLVVILVALAALGLVSWMRRRDLEGLEDAETAREPIAVPVEATPMPARVTTPVPTPAPAPVTTPGTATAGAVSRTSTVIERTDDPEHPFGPGSAAPKTDGSGPSGWTIKGNADSGLYHGPASPSWRRMHAEAWFESEAAAEAAGFQRWDWRRNAS